jgi:hypothetical protein
LPLPVWPLAGQCLLGQNVVVGSMTLLLAVRGNIATRSMSGPPFALQLHRTTVWCRATKPFLNYENLYYYPDSPIRLLLRPKLDRRDDAVDTLCRLVSGSKRKNGAGRKPTPHAGKPGRTPCGIGTNSATHRPRTSVTDADDSTLPAILRESRRSGCGKLLSL